MSKHKYPVSDGCHSVKDVSLIHLRALCFRFDSGWPSDFELRYRYIELIHKTPESSPAVGTAESLSYF